MKIENRLSEFDALKAIATLLLMALHSGVFSFDDVFGIDLNPIALFVATFLLGSFFFIAGYFEELSLDKHGNNFRVFIKNKFIRIYPPYWLALIAFVFVMGISLNKKFDLLVYILSLQFLFSPGYVKQILTVWFVSVLVIYYLLFMVFRKYIKSELIYWFILVVMFLGLFLLHVQTKLFDIRFFEYFFLFFLGGYFAKNKRMFENLLKVSVFLKILVWFITIYLLWVLQAKGYKEEDFLFLVVVHFYMLGSLWVILPILRTSIGKWKIWAFLSYASFFTYLCHRPVWHVVLKIFPQTEWQNDVYMRLIPGAILAIIIAYLLQNMYDALIRLLRNRYS